MGKALLQKGFIDSILKHMDTATVYAIRASSIKEQKDVDRFVARILRLYNEGMTQLVEEKVVESYVKDKR